MSRSVYTRGECEECERFVTSLKDGVCKRCRHGEITDMSSTPTGRGGRSVAEFGNKWGYMTDVPVGERRVSIRLHVEGPREESLDVYQALANAIKSEVESRD